MFQKIVDGPEGITCSHRHAGYDRSGTADVRTIWCEERPVICGLTQELEPYMVRAGQEQETLLCELAALEPIRTVFLYIPEQQFWISSIHEQFSDIDYSQFDMTLIHVYMGGTYEQAIDHEQYLISELGGDPDITDGGLQRLLEFNLSFAATFPVPERVRAFLDTAKMYQDRTLVFHQALSHGTLSFSVEEWPRATPYAYYVEKICSFFDEIQHTVVVDESCDLAKYVVRSVNSFNDASYPYIVLKYQPYRKKAMLALDLN